MTLAIIKAIIIAEALRQGFDPNIALAVAKTESSFRPAVVGRAGEVGLYQIRPEFSSISRIELFDPAKNAREGIKQLKYWQIRCGNRYLACYNGGIRLIHLKEYTRRVASAM